MGKITILGEPDVEVGLIRYDGDPAKDGFVQVGERLDHFEELIEKCREMGWEDIQLHVKEDYPMLAQEWEEESHGIFVALAPVLPDEEDSDG